VTAPPYSPCGLAVEWVRSCKKGRWRFYSNAPDVLTPGRYYFLHEKAKHLPCLHPFGSSDWTTGELDPPNRIGEVRTPRGSWSNGQFLGRRPPEVPIGVCGQIGGEWQWPPGAGKGSYNQGVPLLCWTQVNAALVDADEVLAIDQCSLQLAYARILELIYDTEFATVDAFFTEWLGPAAVLTTYIQAALFPAFAIVVTGDFTLVFVTGTTTFQQLATQAFTTPQGPTDQGEFGTVPLWNNAATVVFNRLIADGSHATKPIVIVGHSYGAAIAMCMSARIRAADATRRIALLTFGCPKPGDERMRVILTTVPQVVMANDDDIVCVVPPNLRETVPFLGLLGLTLALLWGRWKPPTLFTYQNVNGAISQGPPLFLDGGALLPLLMNVLAAIPLPIVSGHRIEEYIRRIGLRCGKPAWPVTEPMWIAVFGKTTTADLVMSGSTGIGKGPSVEGGLILSGTNAPHGPDGPTVEGGLTFGGTGGDGGLPFASGSLVFSGKG
jgi:hypothetical protein